MRGRDARRWRYLQVSGVFPNFIYLLLQVRGILIIIHDENKNVKKILFDIIWYLLIGVFHDKEI